jgi:hypothetical protein
VILSAAAAKLTVPARAGAVISLADNTPIYVPGLTAWDNETSGRSIEASGVLRRRPSRIPATPAGGEHYHGLGETYVLEDATWAIVEGS